MPVVTEISEGEILLGLREPIFGVKNSLNNIIFRGNKFIRIVHKTPSSK